MTFSEKLDSFRYLFNECDAPKWLAEFIACYFASKGSDAISFLIQKKDDVAYGLNDQYIILRSEIYTEELVEIANPYAEKEYVFIKLRDFIVLADQIFSKSKLRAIPIVKLAPDKRFDYLESRSYW